MNQTNRREFCQQAGQGLLYSWLVTRPCGADSHRKLDRKPVWVARNGSPVTNVQAAVGMAGGIGQFIDRDDVVVIKPNGQWPRQGYTHTQCIQALIDVILARPGGFDGEIILAEHIQRTPAQAMSGEYAWNISAGANRQNNWPDMSWLELVADYHTRGFDRVNAIPLYNVSADPGNWSAATGPATTPDGRHAWVRLPAYTAVNGRQITPSYPILRSPYSGSLIDLHRGGGVWRDGGYTGRRVRFICLPTLNNHGWGSEDYAGITSAVKCHIGFQEGTSLHSVGYGYNRPDAVGECVGHLITQVLAPTFYLTCAEYSGHISRTSTTATRTRTVGLGTDPVTLDYWMSKHVLYPCNHADYFDPDNDNNTRRTLLGCQAKGVGTVNPEEMDVRVVDLSANGLRLLSPDGGEVWRRGERRAITWVAGGVQGALTIELLRDGVVMGAVAAAVPAADGLHHWMVGRLADGRMVGGAGLTVRIRAGDGGIQAEAGLGIR